MKKVGDIDVGTGNGSSGAIVDIRVIDIDSEARQYQTSHETDLHTQFHSHGYI